MGIITSRHKAAYADKPQAIRVYALVDQVISPPHPNYSVRQN